MRAPFFVQTGFYSNWPTVIAKNVADFLCRLGPARIDRTHLQEPIQIGRVIRPVAMHTVKRLFCTHIRDIQSDMMKVGFPE